MMQPQNNDPQHEIAKTLNNPSSAINREFRDICIQRT